MEKPIILLSGGFDPYHDGHAKMFQAAAQLGDICVILNSDEWLVKKKGKNFMGLGERAGVLHSVKGVEYIWHSETLGSVCDDLERIKLFFNKRQVIFAKGGDRNSTNTPEQDACNKLGIPIIFGLGGNNEQSSSKLLKKWVDEYDNLTDISTIYFNADALETGRFDV